MSLIPPRAGFRRRPRVAALVAGLALSVWIAGCGSVANKSDAGANGGGTGGTGIGTGGSPGDAGIAGAPGGDGAAGAPGDAATDQLAPPLPDGGDAGGTAARWDINSWDNAQWN
jgi:hypothetical protein